MASYKLVMTSKIYFGNGTFYVGHVFDERGKSNFPPVSHHGLAANLCGF
jgi:hypothetical protein